MIVPAKEVSTKAFDYIVTSGLTLAARLSEDSSITVLVIEAGAANLDDPDILAPVAAGSHLGKPQYDWAFKTVPQESCKDRSLPFNRGKGLGGSSAINFLQYHPPCRSDIDAFGELGNAGWNWDLLKDYYIKSERFIKPIETSDAMSYDLTYRGINGPLAVAYPSTMSNFEVPYEMAMHNLGINLAREPTKGTWLTPVTIDPEERVRSYSANKYYQPNACRQNLTVVVSAHVTKVVIELDENGCATAVEVEFMSEEALYTVACIHGEIFHSSLILWIETRVHLPGVGNNVQEHVFANVTCELRPEMASEYLSFDALNDPKERLRQQELYETSGTGIFATCPTCITFVPLASIKSVVKSINEGISSQQISASLQKQYQIQVKHLQDREPSCEFLLSPRFEPGPNPPTPGKQYITVAAHIASNDPLVPPRIDPHYFEHAYDLLQFILDQEPLKKLLTGTELNPGPEVQSDEQIADTVGSCSMLPLSDGGVVDRTLKVYNTTNIRVVDISVVPLHIGAHLQATAYALGEIGADIIKGKVFNV
ncbi:alcohol oxidase [Mycena vulgaris]|nr:alcohol oxidase [Mycena vulgaris]